MSSQASEEVLVKQTRENELRLGGGGGGGKHFHFFRIVS